MLLTKTATVKWRKDNKEWYENKNYTFTEMGDKFEVKTKDLTKGSNIILEVNCDYCGKPCKPRTFNTYIKLRKDVEKDCCTDCQSEKVKDVLLVKYGGHYNKTKEGKDKISKKAKGKSLKNKGVIYDIDYCKKEYLKKGLILLDTEYITCMHKMKYICSEHKDKGIQEKSLTNLFRSVGCPQCAIEQKADAQRLTQEQACNKVLEFTDGKCKLIGEYKGFKEELQLECSCGNKFTFSSLANLRRNLTTGCPSCNQSRYATIVEDWFNQNNIIISGEKKFDDLRGNKNLLKFDFCCNINNYNILIEVDGEFHFYDKKKNLEEFNKQKKYDKLKNEYCIKNNIILARLPYWEFNNILNVKNTLKSIVVNKDFKNSHIVSKIEHYDKKYYM